MTAIIQSSGTEPNSYDFLYIVVTYGAMLVDNLLALCSGYCLDHLPFSDRHCSVASLLLLRIFLNGLCQAEEFKQIRRTIQSKLNKSHQNYISQLLEVDEDGERKTPVDGTKFWQ
jgi:hypothetical protein